MGARNTKQAKLKDNSKKTDKTDTPAIDVQPSQGGIRIIAKVDGFRRGGLIHSGTKIYAPGELNAEQLEALESEPLLIVERFELDDEPDDDGDTKKSQEAEIVKLGDNEIGGSNTTTNGDVS